MTSTLRSFLLFETFLATIPQKI